MDRFRPYSEKGSCKISRRGLRRRNSSVSVIFDAYKTAIKFLKFSTISELGLKPANGKPVQKMGPTSPFVSSGQP